MDRDAFHTTRGPRAILKPGTRRNSSGRIGAPHCGSRDDPGATELHLEGVCESDIGTPALHAVHPLRLAQKLQMDRIECPGDASEARGYACTRSLESARGIFSRRSTGGFEGRQQAAWRMRRLCWGGYPRLRLRRRHPRLSACLLPLRRAGPPAAARLRRRFHSSAHSPAEYRHAAAEGRGVGQAGGPLSRLCAPLTIVSLASGSTPGVARRRATTGAWPLTAATCRGV